MCGDDDPYIDLCDNIVADPGDLSFLEDAEQFCLEIYIQFADLVQNRVALIASSPSFILREKDWRLQMRSFRDRRARFHEVFWGWLRRSRRQKVICAGLNYSVSPGDHFFTGAGSH